MNDREKSKELKLWNEYGDTQKKSNVMLGPYTSYQFIESRRHLLFTAARYKFAMKMLNHKKGTILDLGCNDGFGTHFLAENAKKVIGVDFDNSAIEFGKEEKSLEEIEFICEDFLQDGGKKYGEFDGIVSFDVIEHIYPENLETYMQTVLMNLKKEGVFIIGTPSLESQSYSKENIKGAHVNVYTGEQLEEMLNNYFNNVFLFTQNDEIIHTGHFRMANYLLAVCCYKKSRGGNKNPK